MKRYHDKHIEKQSISLVRFRIEFINGKQWHEWCRPFKVTQLFQYGVVEMENGKGDRLKANGQRIKAYIGAPEEAKAVGECKFDDV